MSDRLEVISRLSYITNQDLGGKSAQSHESDSKLDQWHLYSMFACSCPPEDSSDGGFRSVKELCRLVFPYLKSGNDGQIVSSTFLFIIPCRPFKWGSMLLLRIDVVKLLMSLNI